MRAALVLLVAFFALQFTGGFKQPQRVLPTALCWSLAPSYGDRRGACSHEGEVMIYLWPKDVSRNSPSR